ncbi:Kinesin-like protein KIFC3 [Myotis davidii]|uniref:Kinesin-like protein KIFC3 n=1 Tax=Myotis davidii TaxID=225400 RepID=L5MII2_MYODS|nr:Kinesin-like protein KIFC3 [Myotis davidii]
MVQSRRTPERGRARPAPASPAARPFPHTGPGRLRTGRGKDTPAGGDEDSGARSGARPALAQCRALSVDRAGPGSPRRLYLSLQQAQQDKGCKNKSQGTKEEKLLKRQAPAPGRDREAQDAGGTMNVEKAGGRLFGRGRCSSLSGPPGAAPTVHRMVEAMAQLQEDKAQLQEELAALRERLALRDSDQQATSTQLQNQVESLKEKLISQAQEVSRLRSELAQEEERLSRRLRDSHETIASLRAQSPPIKYVIKTVEVESSKTKQALTESQTRNQHLQEQVAMQRQVLKEMEQQLQSSHQLTAQLRAQIAMYEAELERAHGQMLEEMQSLEEDKNRAIEEAFARAQVEMKAVHENLAGVRTNLLTLQPALRTLTSDYNGLKRQVRGFPLLLQEALKGVKAEIGQAIEEVNSNNQELLRKYRRELQLRKKCHNELVRLKGNIRVIARVRPVTKEDGDGPEASNAVTFDPDDDSVIHLLHKGKPVSFELDKVFSPRASQQDVFQEVQALITSCIDGFNVCIFAYGQTGAGKTYTMEGTPENPGINQRALQLLFSEVQEKASDWEFTITRDCRPLHPHPGRDLLGQEPQEKLEIRLCPDGSGQLYVPGLTEFRVQSVDDINKVFEFGHTNRTTEFTNLNQHSSRSHALLIVTVRGVDCSTGLRTTGSPGRERPLVSPVEKNTSETLYSLKFAERVRSVELGPGARRAELGSWSSQEHLEWEPACQTPPGSTRAHSAPGSGTSSRPGSIRRRLQPSGKSRPLPV